MVNLYKYLWFYGKKPQDSYITVLPANKKIFVKQNQSILTAALEQGLDWPHDCKFGTCSSCKCKLINGKIKPTSETKKSVFGQQKSSLPKNVEEAISLFEKDDQINEVFNQKFIRTIAAIRRVENQAYLKVISSWEREYLLLNV